MFYEENQILRLIKCPGCDKIYEEALILPCGNTLCKNCIYNNKINQPEANSIKCIACLENHDIPKMGFPMNKLIYDLAKEAPKDIYRGKLVEKLKNNLLDIDLKMLNLTQEIDYAVDKIKEHFRNLRNEVQLSKETFIEEINKIGDILFNTIENTEKRCIKNLELNETYKVKQDELHRLIEEINDEGKEIRTYLAQPFFNEETISKYLSQTIENIKKLDDGLNETNSLRYDNKLMKFKASKKQVDLNILGEFAYLELKEPTSDLKANKLMDNLKSDEE